MSMSMSHVMCVRVHAACSQLYGLSPLPHSHSHTRHRSQSRAPSFYISYHSRNSRNRNSGPHRDDTGHHERNATPPPPPHARCWCCVCGESRVCRFVRPQCRRPRHPATAHTGLPAVVYVWRVRRGAHVSRLPPTKHLASKPHQPTIHTPRAHPRTAPSVSDRLTVDCS